MSDIQTGADRMPHGRSHLGFFFFKNRPLNEIVYDKTYPPGTPDFTPIIHSIQATKPDMMFVASYPPGSVGVLRAATESGLKTRFFGGGMVGLQFTPVKLQFGPKLNGVVDYDS